MNDKKIWKKWKKIFEDMSFPHCYLCKKNWKWNPVIRLVICMHSGIGTVQKQTEISPKVTKLWFYKIHRIRCTGFGELKTNRVPWDAPTIFNHKTDHLNAFQKRYITNKPKFFKKWPRLWFSGIYRTRKKYKKNCSCHSDHICIW